MNNCIFRRIYLRIRQEIALRFFIVIIISLTNLTHIFSQKVVTLYYNPYWFLTTKEYSEFYRIAVIDTSDYKFYGIVKDYFKNGKLQMIGNYQASIKNGDFNFYYPSGNLKCAGFYKDNIRWGIWTNYYENGKIKDKIVFNDIFLSVLEYYDENGNLKVSKGTGDWKTQYFNDFGLSNVTISGSFKDSLRDGTWKYYVDNLAIDENQYEKLPSTEIYDNGKFVSGEFYNHDGKLMKMNISTEHVLPETTKFENTEKWKPSIYASKDEYPFLKFLPKVDSSFFPVNRLASFPGGLDSLKTYFRNQIKLKKSYIKSEPQSFCMFKIIITEKGVLKIEEDPNISTLKFYPSHMVFYQQVLKAIKNSPEWDPAVRNQKYVKSHLMLTIRLNNGAIEVMLSSTNQIINNPDLKLISCYDVFGNVRLP
jgi:antitoxin component YwqK of YwqJK toxin-antitoxin module